MSVTTLNDRGFGHHLLIAAILIVVGFTSLGTFKLIRSGAESVKTSDYAIAVSSKQGCKLVGRKYDDAANACLRECQYPHADGVRYNELTPGKAVSGFCTSYVNAGASAEERNWCLNSVHRYYIDYIGCAKKHGQESNANHWLGCQPQFPNYVATGSTDYCVATPVAPKQSAGAPAATSSPVTVKQPKLAQSTSLTATTNQAPAADSAQSLQPSAAVSTTTSSVTTSTAAVIATSPSDTGTGNACSAGQVVALVTNSYGEQRQSCSPADQVQTCTTATQLTVTAGGLRCLTRLSKGNLPRYQVVDTRIEPFTCKLLGRLPVDSYTTKGGDFVAGGCSRSSCLDPQDHIKQSINAEICFRRAKDGPAFATYVDNLKCARLHRIWVRQVNACISNPYRSQRTITDSNRCLKPFTTYVNHTETEGNYDECITPSQAQKVGRLAKQVGKPFTKVAAMTSKTLCAFRPNTAYVDGYCVASTRPIDDTVRRGTLIIGDSITWRGTNELHRLRSSWTVDGIPGRPVGDLPERIRYYLKGHPDPAVLIVALGTNPTQHWTQADYEQAIKLVPDTTKVIFVTPYRLPSTLIGPAFIKTVNGYARNMHDIVASRPNSCLADYAKVISKHPAILTDGTHPSTAGEQLWANFISQQWDSCLNQS